MVSVKWWLFIETHSVEFLEDEPMKLCAALFDFPTKTRSEILRQSWKQRAVHTHTHCVTHPSCQYLPKTINEAPLRAYTMSYLLLL